MIYLKTEVSILAYEEVYIEFWSSQKKKKRVEAQDKMDDLEFKVAKNKKIKDKNKR